MLSPKCISHKQNCIKCTKADDFKSQCRIGRRLMIASIKAMDADIRDAFLMGFPDDILKEITDALGMEKFITIEKPDEQN